MNSLERIVKILEQEQLSPSLQQQEITWQNSLGNKCLIFENDIATDGERIAWFESDFWHYHSLRILENGEVFNWTPKTYNPVFGCICLLMEWYKDHLIFIYQEKHDIYICSIQNKEVKHFNFNGEEIARKGDLISFQTFTNKTKDTIRIIQIPELHLPEPISITEASELGLLPEGLNRPDGFLKHTPENDHAKT